MECVVGSPWCAHSTQSPHSGHATARPVDHRLCARSLWSRLQPASASRLHSQGRSGARLDNRAHGPRQRSRPKGRDGQGRATRTGGRGTGSGRDRHPPVSGREHRPDQLGWRPVRRHHQSWSQRRAPRFLFRSIVLGRGGGKEARSTSGKGRRLQCNSPGSSMPHTTAAPPRKRSATSSTGHARTMRTTAARTTVIRPHIP